MSIEEAKKAVLERHPSARAIKMQDYPETWQVCNMFGTALGNELLVEDSAWLSAARRILEEKK